MKQFMTLLALCVTVLSAADEVIPELRLLNGRFYKQVKVTKKDAAELRIMHADGFATVRLSDLEPESLALFGGKIDKQAERMADAERDLVRARNYAPVVSSPAPSAVPASVTTVQQPAEAISAEENARRAWEWYQWCEANPAGDAQINQQQRDMIWAQATQTLQAWQATQSNAATVSAHSGPLSTRPATPVGRSANDPQRIAERMARQQWQQAVQPQADWSVWHSAGADVCHNNAQCTTGNNIERENLRPGQGDRPLCQECQKLNLYAQAGVLVPQAPSVPTAPSVPVMNGYWHSAQQNVCHANPRCTTGNNIERAYLQMGTGNKPLCQECARLIQSGR